MRITRTFDQVKYPARKVVKCANCNKRITRQTTFMQTLNPYNRNENGEIKSQAEIWKELDIEAKKWQKQHELCSKCCKSLTGAAEAGEINGLIIRQSRKTDWRSSAINVFSVVVKDGAENYWLSEIRDVDNFDPEAEYRFDDQTSGGYLNSDEIKKIKDNDYSCRWCGFFVNSKMVFDYTPKSKY